jgi:hypothetical protein
LWGKKRGARRTGSRLLGSLGEALFFGFLFLLGSVSLAVLAASWLRDPTPGLFTDGFGSWLIWLLLAVFASFVLIGGGGVIYTVVQVGASAERRSALAKRAAEIDLTSDGAPKAKMYPNIPSDANLTNSPGITLAYRLPIAKSPVWRLSAAAAFCLAWNGGASALLALAINNHLAGRPEWFLSISVVCFLAVGLWSVYYFAKQLLIHTGVGPSSVEISDHPLRPGGRYEVFLAQAGRLSVRSLEVLLVCDEETTYRQGTDIRTEARSVHQQQVFLRENFKIEAGFPFEHRGQLHVPETVMHSFQSDHNAVYWKLVVKGEVEAWPPFVRTFPVIVHPASNGAGDA